jgi:hypothetical protein
MVVEAAILGGDQLGVVGSDEGGCFGRYGSGSGVRRQRAHVKQ